MYEKTAVARIDDSDLDVIGTAVEFNQWRSINWGAVFAGLFVAMIVYSALLVLGMAVGSESLSQAAQSGTAAQNLGVGATAWAIFSVIVSLFVGGFAGAQVAGRIPARVGRVQGLVISSVFFAVLFAQAGLVVGALGSGIGSTAKALGQGVFNSDMMSSVGQQVITQGLDDLNLKSPPETVARGVAERLMRGDSQGALNYITDQAGVSRGEAEAKINQLKDQFQQAVADAANKAGIAIKLAAWTIFASLILGSLFAVLGGQVAVRRNWKEAITSTKSSFAA